MTNLQMRAKLYSRSHKGQDRGAGGFSVVINEKPGGNPQFSDPGTILRRLSSYSSHGGGIFTQGSRRCELRTSKRRN
jgi:hypothetical protein